MKKILKYTAAIVAGLLAFGCAPQILEVDQSLLPQASEIEPVVVIDQETNTVTFSIKNTEMVPIWIFGETVINGRVNSRYYTGNNISVVVNDRGEHTIEVKAYNGHGTSVGSMPVTFTMENYVPYNKGLAGWDPDENGNLWRDAVKSNKTYYYAPGWAQLPDPALVESGDEYTLTFPEATTDQWQAQFAFANTGLSTVSGKNYDFQVVLNSNNALPGVTIKLTDDADDNIFYFADRHEVPAGEDFAYQVADFEGQDIANLKLVFDFGGNPANTEVTIKQIILSEHQDNHTVEVVEEEIYGAWDADIDANMWKTAATDNITCWFADGSWAQISNPDYTASNGTYTITLPEGMGGAQWMGQFTVNHTGIALEAGKKYDLQFVLKSTADHPGVTIKPCNGVEGSGDDPYLEDRRHALTAGENYLYQLADIDGEGIPDLKIVFDFGGGEIGSEVKISRIIVCEHQADHVLAGEDPNKNTLFEVDAEENLWLTAKKNELFFYYAPGWNQIANPELTADGENYFTISLPTATEAQWQAQFAFKNIGISTSAGKLYDFQVILKANTDLGGVTIKLTDASSDEVFYFADSHRLKAGTDYVYQMSNLEGKDIEDLSLFFDFGGNPEDTEVIIKDIIIQEHRSK